MLNAQMKSKPKMHKYNMKKSSLIPFISTLLFCACETQIETPTTEDNEEYEFKVENGILPGIFSVSDSTTIHFSQGNLQYHVSTNSWRFAEHQTDVIEENFYTLKTTKYSEIIDLFGWATSGFNNTKLDSLAVNYQPWSTSNQYNPSCTDNPYGYGFSLFFLDTIKNDTINIILDFSIDSTNYDWGIYNAIENGGNQDSLWRTLTQDEWHYLIYQRKNAEKLYGIASINGTNGIIFLPDNWISPSDITFNPGLGNAFGIDYFKIKNYFNANKWHKMQLAGAVFLPACGFRNGIEFNNLNITGAYWTSSCPIQNNPRYLYFYSNYLTLTSGNNPHYGHAVRLVYQQPIQNN